MARRKRRRKKARQPGPTGPAEPAQPTWRDRLASRADKLARTRWFFPAALVVLTFAVYARSINCPLIHWDDYQYICEDTRIQELSPGNAWRILTSSFALNYVPLATFTFALDRAVWGNWLPGFHLTQLAFYAGGVVLLYFVFRAILGSAPAAFAGAAIYAAHTIHVESVVWLASRKDVVCLVFYAAAILAYLRYAREKERPYRYYALFTALAAAAMFSKGYAAALPAVLLAYDACFGKRIGRRQILDKLPLFALALFLTVVMIQTQERDAAPLLGEIGASHRFVILCKVYAAYAGRAVLPVRLSVNYLVHFLWLHHGVAVLGAILGAGTVAGFFLLRRKLPAAAFGIAIFLLQLSTVMSTFFTLRHWIADRYIFFPTIGSTLALAAGGLWLHKKKELPRALRRWAIPAAATATVALYTVLTVGRIGVWKSELDIWSDAVRKQVGLRGSGPLALREIRGRKVSGIFSLLKVQDAYKRAGKQNEAGAFMALIVKLAEKTAVGNHASIRLAQRNIEAGRYDDAIRRLRPVAEQGKFEAAAAWFLIGEAHRGKGEREKARAAYEKAVERYRASGRSGVNLAIIEEKLGHVEGAIRHLEEVLRLAPDHPQREAIRAKIKDLRRRLRVPP